MATGNGRRLVVALGLCLAAATVQAETLSQRVERMEQELRALKEELRRRDAEDRAREAEKTQPPPAAAAPPPAEKAPVATTRGAVPATALREVVERVKLGGYGSFRYEGSSLEDQHNTFTYRRFVLTADASIAPRLRAYMELEFERFRELELEKAFGPEEGGLEVEQTVEGTNESEIAFEQAWLQYDIEDWLKFRGGAVLVPLGRFNLNHDDNRWDIPRRSLVDRGVPVLPVAAAWDELGVGLLGDVPVGKQGILNYQAYVVNGASLDFEFEQVAQTRAGDAALNLIEAELEPATGTFSNDLKDAKAGTARLAWSPFLGHEVGLSGYYGQYTPDFLGNEGLYSVALDGRTGWGPFELEGEWVYSHFSGTKNVARQLARTAGEQSVEFENPDLETEVEFELAGLARVKQGYWIEGRYRFWPSFLSKTFLAWEFDDPQLIAVLRGEQVWLDDLVEEVDFTGGTLTDFETDDRSLSRFTVGLAYRPVPLVVFQLAYEYTQTNDGESLAGVTNFMPAQPGEDHASTVMVGAAFGF